MGHPLLCTVEIIMTPWQCYVYISHSKTRYICTVKLVVSSYLLPAEGGGKYHQDISSDQRLRP